MSKKAPRISVFVSYCHSEGDWVWQRLVPCLRASQVDYYIDTERFQAGKALIGEMDDTQDNCEKHLLVLSPEYFTSKYCCHELNRALLRDPQFKTGHIIPLVRIDCQLPDIIAKPNPLCVDLRDDNHKSNWDLLFKALDTSLGTSAPHWLEALEHVCKYLCREQSVNLVVKGKPRWYELVSELRQAHFPHLVTVDLESPSTATRRGLIGTMLKACGVFSAVPKEPEDLLHLSEVFENRPLTRVALVHFDYVASRPHYHIDFFSALRFLIMTSRKLVVLIESKDHFANLLPVGNPLSEIDIKTVELHGAP